MEVPFVDLKMQHCQLKNDILKIVDTAVENAQFIGGKNVSEFETAFSEFCGTQFAIGVSSGTDALRFALIAAGVGPGQTVITVPNTFIATTEAISQIGAKVAFVDVGEKTDTMNVELLEKCIQDLMEEGQEVRAIIPVHLYGQIAEMNGIQKMASKYELTVIEDACQAHGAQFTGKWETSEKGKRAGSLGHAGCFSFYPGKNLGACGEGGAVVTDDENLAHKIRILRDHGQSQKYYHEIEGYNGRLDAIQAGILRLKLNYLEDWNQKRRQNAQHYNSLLHDFDSIEIPVEPAWSRGVYHLYVIKLQDRDRVQKALSDKGVATGLHYPVPLHLQNAYKGLGYMEGAFPITEDHAKHLLSLPMYAELTFEQIEYVVNTLKEVC
jgi:dTDP-4-amino-4,6-dideoxygalactose transaminase